MVFEPLQSNMTDTRNFAKNFAANRRQHGFALLQVPAADEDGGVFLVLRRAGEYRAFHQTADIGFVHAAVGGNVVGAAIVADDIVKD